MKTENLLKDTLLDFYPNVKSNKPDNKVTLYDWLTFYPMVYKNHIEDIRKTNKIDEAKAKQMKIDYLPLVSVSATFNGIRKTENVNVKHPIICIDIDKNDNPEITDWDETKKKIMQSKIDGIFYTSLSARGEGIFVLVYYNSSNDFISTWFSLEKDFAALGITIDKACKDITRLRFLSLDEQGYFYKEIKQYNKTLVKEDTRKFEPLVSNEYSDQLNEDDIFTYKAIHYLIKKCGYRANTYNDWLVNGFRLATFGYYGELLFMYLSQVSDNFKENEAKHKFENCKIHTTSNKSCLSYYFKQLKDILGPSWKQIINEYTL